MGEPAAARPPGAAAAKAVLIGFMGAGKSTAARLLGDDALDVDEVIEARLGRSIVTVFADDGEAAFREVEERVTLELLERAEQPVLALGGGAVLSEKVRAALRGCRVIWLASEADEVWERVRAGGAERPLAGDLRAFLELHAAREPLYESLADVIVPSSRARQIKQVLRALEGLPDRGVRVLWAASDSGDYPVYIGAGLLLDERFWPAAVRGRRVLVSDQNAGRLYGATLSPLHAEIRIMPGEQSKTVAHAEIVWSEMVRHGVTRADVVAALGGGVVGDLAGFCAATYQRGVRYVQVPTTLLAQVDSAYGGKTGVDLVEAKNYVGAFHQPSAVIADPRTLATLPAEELAAGYGEVLKTGLIAGGGLWDRIVAGARGDEPDVIADCALTKLRIVERDERDGGVRQLLNLGHTVAHAIEAATGYALYRHGEAVGLGLLAELRLAGADSLRAQVRELLATHGLPVGGVEIDPNALVAAAALDKKRLIQGSGVPFVRCEQPGRVEMVADADPAELRAAVQELML
jgi:shikimate kinase/3-dehydroquinate synthase